MRKENPSPDAKVQAELPDRRNERGDWQRRRRPPSKIPQLTTPILVLTEIESEAARLGRLGVHARNVGDHFARAAHCLQHFDAGTILVVRSLGSIVEKLCRRHTPHVVVIERTENIKSHADAAAIAGGRAAA